MTTHEELREMTTDEKIERYASDVIGTGTEELDKEKGNISFQYDFLFGAGSLGYPFGKSSPVGEAVKKIANDLGLLVWWNMENSYANFSGKITQEVVAKHFRPIWEESDRQKEFNGAH